MIPWNHPKGPPGEPEWFALRGRTPPRALTHDEAWYNPPQRGRLRRRLQVLLGRRALPAEAPPPPPECRSPSDRTAEADEGDAEDQAIQNRRNKTHGGLR